MFFLAFFAPLRLCVSLFVYNPVDEQRNRYKPRHRRAGD